MDRDVKSYPDAGAGALRKAAERYSGGETLEETLPKVQTENQRGFKCSIATRDPEIQAAAPRLVDAHRPNVDTYEFESLFGICTQQLVDLKDAGHR